MSGTNYVTAETFERLKTELQHLKAVDRPAASHAIAEAREKGDLKENAEYDAAKEAQGMLEAKIKHLEGVIANARILDEKNIDTSKVSILTNVTLTNLNTKKKVTYKIVSENEADLKQGKISVLGTTSTWPVTSGSMSRKAMNFSLSAILKEGICPAMIFEKMVIKNVLIKIRHKKTHRPVSRWAEKVF